MEAGHLPLLNALTVRQALVHGRLVVPPLVIVKAHVSRQHARMSRRALLLSSVTDETDGSSR